MIQEAEIIQQLSDFRQKKMDSFRSEIDREVFMSQIASLLMASDKITNPSEELLKSQADSEFWFGTIHSKQGNRDQAINHLKRALKIRIQLFGELNSIVATTFNKLGIVYRGAKELKLAMESHQKALQIREKVCKSSTDASIAESLVNLGIVLLDFELEDKEKATDKELGKEAGKIDKSIEYLERALKIYEEICDKPHRSLGICLNNLGIAYQKNKEVKKAVEFYERAINIKEKVHGINSLSVAITLENLAQCLEISEDVKQSAECLERSFAIKAEIYEEGSPELEQCSKSLAYYRSILAASSAHKNLISMNTPSSAGKTLFIRVGSLDDEQQQLETKGTGTHTVTSTQKRQAKCPKFSCSKSSCVIL